MTDLTEFKFFGVTFYEHPHEGDEGPLLVRRNGRLAVTYLFDRPSSCEEARAAFDDAEEWEDLQDFSQVFNR